MRLPDCITNKLWARAVNIVINRDPDFVVGSKESPYLRRWWVIPRNRFFNIYLHQILRDDDDRVLHDHPWLNVSVLLQGSYVEVKILAGGVNEIKLYERGHVIFRRARSAHRLKIDAGCCWSLFITGPVVRPWGFHCPKGWRHWKEYVDERDSGTVGKGCDE